MNNEPYKLVMQQLCEKTEELNLSDDDKIVIFSDLHVGDRKSLDDFKGNSEILKTVLNDYYYEKGYTLILNGDVEELHRYSVHEIRKQWTDLYSIFDQFFDQGRLYKLFGNHDSKLFSLFEAQLRYPLYESLKLKYKDNALFLFHGHQLSYFYQKFNDFMGLILRFVAKPLRIKHYSVAHDKRKKFTIERRAYDFAKENGMVAVLGHTHRPLFESMSKIDTLNYQIETLLRRYHKVSKTERAEIEDKVRNLKKEIDRLEAKEGKEISISRIYSNTTVVPCVFNSGCVIGKRGMTAIELSNGQIKLVHWFDSNVDKKYVRDDVKNTTNLKGTDFFRTVLKSDDLDYIFTRIRLLT